MIGKGAKIVPVSIERGLLKEADSFAKRHKQPVVKIPRVGAPRRRAGIKASRRSSIAAKYRQVSTTKSSARGRKQRDFDHGLLSSSDRRWSSRDPAWSCKRRGDAIGARPSSRAHRCK